MRLLAALVTLHVMVAPAWGDCRRRCTASDRRDAHGCCKKVRTHKVESEPPAQETTTEPTKACTDVAGCTTACAAGKWGDCTELSYLLNLEGKYVEAVQAAWSACKGKQAVGCFNLGAIYEAGSTGLRSDALALACYKWSCGMGYADGCKVYDNLGAAVGVTELEALTGEGQRCMASQADACVTIADRHLYGRGVPYDPAAARIIYRHACDELGDPTGCNNAAFLLAHGVDTPVNLPAAVALYERACAGNLATGCASLGLLLAAGVGTSQDQDRAWQLLTAACDRGESWGCDMAGNWLVNADRAADAAPFYDRACTAGHGPACVDLGVLRQDGKVDGSYGDAVTLFGRACDAGEPRGCFYLGSAYLAGTLAPVNYRHAYVYLLKACRQSMPVACTSVGSFYEHGWGVAKNAGRARDFYDWACKAGEEHGCQRLR